MSDAPFRPFDTLLDEATALATLRAATAELGPISRASTLFGRPQLGKS